MVATFSERLELLKQSTIKQSLTKIKHGVERETLRVNQNGSLAQTPHNERLGSALTHDYITTDFSESLLEFITPPESDVSVSLQQLSDVHKYVMQNIGEERLWPMSMPCFVESDDQIPIAQYGESNVGKMKTLYRVGLKNRYGSMMQAISGVHFNFSLPEEFWQSWLPASTGDTASTATVSAAYFAMIRNYRRFCWLIPFLFGASPALCGSFIRGKETALPFKKLGQGTYYLPYATSLRMSDLGYTNSEQSGLQICYNQVDSYIDSLRKAINTPSEKYQQFSGKKDGKYLQLNANVLQIENELYSPIRPKQPTESLEKPTDALAKRGVSYIEVRALDVDPFSAIGITDTHFYFLDVFLTYCAIAPSEFFNAQQYAETEDNLNAAVERGRDPALMLSKETEQISLPQWSKQLFDDMQQVAEVLDDANGNGNYTNALEEQRQKTLDYRLTPSAKMLDIMLNTNKDNGYMGVELAEHYREELLSSDYGLLDEVTFAKLANDSLCEQERREAADSQDFDAFLHDYFET